MGMGRTGNPMTSGCFRVSNPVDIAEKVGEKSVAIIGGIMANKAARANRKTAFENASLVTDQAAREEGQLRREGAQLTGSQIATAGASGLTTDSFAPSIIDSAVNSELAALNARYKGAVEATGFRNQAQALKLQGKQALWGGIISGVGGTIFKGLGSQTVAGQVAPKSGRSIDPKTGIY